MVLKKTNILCNSNEISKIFNKNIDKDWTCTGVEIDSRKVKPGNIFLAMPGTEFDGHNFIKDAINMGANSLIIKESVNITKDNLKSITIPTQIIKEREHFASKGRILWDDRNKYEGRKLNSGKINRYYNFVGATEFCDD